VLEAEKYATCTSRCQGISGVETAGSKWGGRTAALGHLHLQFGQSEAVPSNLCTASNEISIHCNFRRRPAADKSTARGVGFSANSGLWA